jgi:hypothetical protein
MMTPTRSLDEVLMSLCDRTGDFADCNRLTVNSVAASGDTPLHVAIARGDLPAAEVLLQNGANVDGSGDNTETPLHVAIRQRNVAAVQLLLERGARLDTRSEFGRTPAEEAARCVNEATQILHLFRQDPRHMTCSFCGRSGDNEHPVIQSTHGGTICERCIQDLPGMMREMKGVDGAA